MDLFSTTSTRPRGRRTAIRRAPSGGSQKTVSSVSRPSLNRADAESAARRFSLSKMWRDRSSRATRSGLAPVVASSHRLTWTAADRSRWGGLLALIQAATQLNAGVHGSSAGSSSGLAGRRLAGMPIRVGKGGAAESHSCPPGAGKSTTPASASAVSAAERRRRAAHEPAQALSARFHRSHSRRCSMRPRCVARSAASNVSTVSAGGRLAWVKGSPSIMASRFPLQRVRVRRGAQGRVDAASALRRGT